jgi:hypothetical protein
MVCCRATTMRHSGRRGAGFAARRRTTTAVRHHVERWKAVVIMPKPRSTLPIAHADDVPTIAFTDEEWQAIEHAYAQQLNADVRQQITTVTTQYLKDCVFERTVAPKAMAWERIERIRREAGDLNKVMLDSKPFSCRRPSSRSATPPPAPTARLPASPDELSRGQQRSARYYANHLIRRHFTDPRLAAGRRGRRDRRADKSTCWCGG